MIKAITGGYINIHPSTFRMSRPKGLPHFILLVVRSHGSFDIGSEHFSVEPPQIIILAPHTPNYYGNPDGDYIDDWLHFDTDEPKLIERLNAISNHPFSVEDTNIFSFCIHHILLELSFGQSFQQDLILMRVTRARFNLSTSNLSLSQIAELCGYNNEVHFYRQFKKLTGVTPAQYRKHPF